MEDEGQYYFVENGELLLALQSRVRLFDSGRIGVIVRACPLRHGSCHSWYVFSSRVRRFEISDVI